VGVQSAHHYCADVRDAGQHADYPDSVDHLTAADHDSDHAPDCDPGLDSDASHGGHADDHAHPNAADFRLEGCLLPADAVEAVPVENAVLVASSQTCDSNVPTAGSEATARSAPEQGVRLPGLSLSPEVEEAERSALVPSGREVLELGRRLHSKLLLPWPEMPEPCGPLF
jgi:hypothetical protein